MKLTSDQIDVYRRDGVVPIGKVLDEATVGRSQGSHRSIATGAISSTIPPSKLARSLFAY